MERLKDIQSFEKGEEIGQGRHKIVHEVLNSEGELTNFVVAYIKDKYTHEEQRELVENQIKAMQAMKDLNIGISGYIGAAADLETKRMFLVKERSTGESLRDFNVSAKEILNNISSKEVKKFVIFILKNLTCDFPVDIDKPLDNIFYSWENEEYYNVDSLEPGEKDSVFRITMKDLMVKIYTTFNTNEKNLKQINEIKNIIQRVVNSLGIPEKFLSELTKAEITLILSKIY